MLNKRNLDDQSYQEIVRSAMGRLPWLCPVWTDHNAHDPGVTVLELMAWYKEMQQYQLNQFTDGLKEKLLKLAGVKRRPAAAAVCALEVGEGEDPHPVLSRLEMPEGIPFELDEEIPALRPRICHVRTGEAELWEMLSGGLTFQPFGPGGKDTLRIGLERRSDAPLKLYFQVAPPPAPPRNPFLRSDQRPRELRWTLEGFGPVEPLEDETHALSQSGFVRFPSCSGWTAGEDGLCWLEVELIDPGCEETVRLSGLSVSRYRAVQRETWAWNCTCSVPPEPWETFIPGAMARDSELAVFLRQNGRWEQTTEYETIRELGGLRVRLDGRGSDQDGEDNVLLVCLDRDHLDCLLFDTVGLPGEQLLLDLGERRILDISLLCQTLDRDGKVRLHPWRWVDDLAPCGPRDRVFAYDARRKTLTFGNGEQGAVIRPGKGSVLVTGLRVSLGRDGNVPANAGLRFLGVDRAVENGSAAGGRDRETVEEAAVRFLRELGSTEKCVTAGDYERLVRNTPGLRVGVARAIPGYDREEPTGRSSALTVVAAPASGEKRPMPDRRFLEEVRTQLEAHRMVCTQVKVTAPVYEDVDVSASLRTQGTLDREAARRLVEGYLSPERMGGPLRAGDLAARLQAVPGVLQVKRLDLRALSPGCYQDAAGDIHMSPIAIPVLRQLELEEIPFSEV